MDHQDEYYDNLITMLELIWGEGYMTPGGSGNVEKMFNGIEIAGKRTRLLFSQSLVYVLRLN